MIILDNTALSAFAHIDRLDIFSKLFGEISIPESVYYEGVLKAKKSKRVDRIRNCIEEGLIKVIKPAKEDIESAKKLPVTLGLGERYTIAMGISKKCLIETDDLKPRKIAKELGMDIIGTLGILRLAYKRNLINKDELGQLVDMLHEILFFTDDLEKWVLFSDRP
jgi:predicted nucleic acid-binding protein